MYGGILLLNDLNIHALNLLKLEEKGQSSWDEGHTGRSDSNMNTLMDSKNQRQNFLWHCPSKSYLLGSLYEKVISCFAEQVYIYTWIMFGDDFCERLIVCRLCFFESLFFFHNIYCLYIGHTVHVDKK